MTMATIHTYNIITGVKMNKMFVLRMLLLA